MPVHDFHDFPQPVVVAIFPRSETGHASFDRVQNSAVFDLQKKAAYRVRKEGVHLFVHDDGEIGHRLADGDPFEMPAVGVGDLILIPPAS